ncbi:hypothetical protein ACFB49_17050 [Sphingomonas sp. DBB INV C78]|uniref:aspartyl protease family protein n=1 Tax=Sphingomonas sp. DBB INV C78 TaxID=3349434 RepID=UPI0036D38508
MQVSFSISLPPAVPVGKATSSVAFAGGDDRPLQIPITVDGHAACAVLDTGATRTVVDRGFAERHGLIGRGLSVITGLTAQVGGAVTRPVRIKVGDVGLGPKTGVVTDLGRMAQAARTDVDVVLGHDLFLDQRVEFDFAAGRLLLSRQPFAADTDCLALERIDHRLFAIEAHIAPEITTAAVVDLGSMLPLYASADFVRAHGLFEGRRVATSISLGVEGVSVVQTVRLPWLKLGDAMFRDVPLAVPDSWALGAPVVIGLPIWSRFRLGLDMGRRQIRLAAVHDLAGPFPRDRSGLSVVAEGDRLKILHVSPASPADDAGLKAGDAILGVNGQRIDTDFLAAHRNMGKKAAGTRYVLDIEGGEQAALVLRDYF